MLTDTQRQLLRLVAETAKTTETRTVINLIDNLLANEEAEHEVLIKNIYKHFVR